MNPSASKARILIVDDSKVSAYVLSEAFVEEHEVLTASSGEQALTIAGSETPPDIILLDIVMPQMDGYEVCRRLKAQPATKDIPVIFISGLDSQDDETKGLEHGVVDYITKPFKLPIVKARVRTHLALRHMERERLHLSKVQGVLEMATAAVHEFSQPLQVLINEIGFLSSYAQQDDDFKASLGALDQAAKMLYQIVDKVQKITQYKTVSYYGDAMMIDLDHTAE